MVLRTRTEPGHATARDQVTVIRRIGFDVKFLDECQSSDIDCELAVEPAFGIKDGDYKQPYVQVKHIPKTVATTAAASQNYLSSHYTYFAHEVGATSTGDSASSKPRYLLVGQDMGKASIAYNGAVGEKGWHNQLHSFHECEGNPSSYYSTSIHRKGHSLFNRKSYGSVFYFAVDVPLEDVSYCGNFDLNTVAYGTSGKIAPREVIEKYEKERLKGVLQTFSGIDKKEFQKWFKDNESLKLNSFYANCGNSGRIEPRFVLEEYLSKKRLFGFFKKKPGSNQDFIDINEEEFGKWLKNKLSDKKSEISKFYDKYAQYTKSTTYGADKKLAPIFLLSSYTSNKDLSNFNTTNVSRFFTINEKDFEEWVDKKFGSDQSIGDRDYAGKVFRNPNAMFKKDNKSYHFNEALVRFSGNKNPIKLILPYPYNGEDPDKTIPKIVLDRAKALKEFVSLFNGVDVTIVGYDDATCEFSQDLSGFIGFTEIKIPNGGHKSKVQHNHAVDVYKQIMSNDGGSICNLPSAIEFFEEKLAGGAKIDFSKESPVYWWMFPVNRKGIKGWGYVVDDDVIDKLLKDDDFVKLYRRGIEIYFASFGWDINQQNALEGETLASVLGSNENKIQFAKCLYSMKLFGFADEYNSALRFLKTSGIELGAESWCLSNEPAVIVESGGGQHNFKLPSFAIFNAKKSEFSTLDYIMFLPIKTLHSADEVLDFPDKVLDSPVVDPGVDADSDSFVIDDDFEDEVSDLETDATEQDSIIILDELPPEKKLGEEILNKPCCVVTLGEDGNVKPGAAIGENGNVMIFDSEGFMTLYVPDNIPTAGGAGGDSAAVVSSNRKTHETVYIPYRFEPSDNSLIGPLDRGVTGAKLLDCINSLKPKKLADSRDRTASGSVESGAKAISLALGALCV